MKLHAIIVNWDSSNVKARPTDLEALEPRQIIKVGGTIEIILIKFALLCWVIQESTEKSIKHFSNLSGLEVSKGLYSFGYYQNKGFD